MKKAFLALTVILSLLVITLAGVMDAARNRAADDAVKAGELTAKAQRLTEQLTVKEQQLLDIEVAKRQDEALLEFTLTAMDMAPAVKLSDAKRRTTAEKVVKFAAQYISIFDVNGRVDVKATQDAREQYVSMVKIESNFENNARSPVGATGIGQIMPGTFNWTVKLMEIGARPEDISSEDINLTVGAFYYNMLLGEQKNNPRLASIAYNGGTRTADQFKKLVDINKESANYALKTDHVKETVKETVDAKTAK